MTINALIILSATVFDSTVVSFLASFCLPFGLSFNFFVFEPSKLENDLKLSGKSKKITSNVLNIDSTYYWILELVHVRVNRNVTAELRDNLLHKNLSKVIKSKYL